jgi:hypothetical protein
MALVGDYFLVIYILCYKAYMLTIISVTALYKMCDNIGIYSNNYISSFNIEAV